MSNVLLVSMLLAAASPQRSTNIYLNPSDSTRFDGIGAISGGGGETVLLPSYPSAQRNEILDYLFKPGFGASLQIIKVEIGGDGLSTDGSEPSHMHTDGPPDFTRGVEWFVLQEAKKRNEGIIVYGLPWEWPAWVGEVFSDTLTTSGTPTGCPYKNISNAVKYTTTWLKGALNEYGIQVDYLGLWNENDCTAENGCLDYVLELRKALDRDSALSAIKLVGADCGANGDFPSVIAKNSTVASAIHALGFHYPDAGSKLPSVVKSIGKPLWASEDSSTVELPPEKLKTDHPRALPGGGCLARTINQNWVQGNLASTIVWNLIMARYPQLRWDYTGFVTATDPFNGHYDVMSSVWAVAHTCQFTEPGWDLLKVGQGSGWLPQGGSFVSYVNQTSKDLTIVIEKLSSFSSRCTRGAQKQDVNGSDYATFFVGSVIETSKMALWASNFSYNAQLGVAGPLFQRIATVPVSEKGTVELNILPDMVYTLTTLATGSHGTTNTIPTSGSFPEKYSNTFSDCVPGATPEYLSPMSGSFECVRTDSETTIVQQLTPQLPICDRGDSTPYAIIGDPFRTSYNISLSISINDSDPQAGGFVGARCKGPVGNPTGGMDGIYFALTKSEWKVVLGVGTLTNASGCNGTILKSGLLSNLVTAWNTLTLSVNGTQATGSLNGQILFKEIEVPAPYEHFTGRVDGYSVPLGKGGYAAIGTVGYSDVSFRDMTIISF